MEKVSVCGVSETMLQTLYARAAYSQGKAPLFVDAKAVEIVSEMDYDFTLAKKDAAMSSGVIARTILLDGMVGAFIRDNPSGTVINIACGMDTRVYRLDNGTIRWINIDLPEAIAVRRRFLPEERRISAIACSAMDARWAREIGQVSGEVLVVVEGLAMYLSEADVKAILSIISGRFARVKVIMEIMNPFIVGHVREKSIEATRAKFTWGAASGRELARLVPELAWVEDVSLVEGMKELYPVYRVIGKIPMIRNLSNKLAVLQKA
ncbi:MAG: class I SAM-dependent methyltransferase [Clostridia bacterium]|nr:class I SAM-dependent methyltransferase [Clostridia bacterium]